MSNLLLIGSKLSNVPPPVGPQPGDAMGGGYLVGKMNYGGVSYYLIIAEQASETSLAWKTAATADAGPISLFDGLANSNSINDASHPAAQYCRAYTGGGFTDWYLGARDEMELAFRNLKPIIFNNDTAPRMSDVGGGQAGVNANSIPPGAQYTLSDPNQTPALNFRNTGTQYLNSSGSAYWTSTQGVGASPATNNAVAKFMSNGSELAVGKTNPTGLVRPMRRIPVTPIPAFGDAYEGGFYAGRMSIGGSVYDIVISPKSTEVTRAFKTSNTPDGGANSLYDGLANSNALNDAAHPAIQYCRSLTTGGKTDWYLGSRDENELFWRNLKVNNSTNDTSTRAAAVGGGANGLNTNSIPNGAAYTATVPARTAAVAFQTSGAQAMTGSNVAGTGYLTSTCDISGSQLVINQMSSNGFQTVGTKGTATYSVRAIRRVLVV